jgi:acetyl esterase/lipase
MMSVLAGTPETMLTRRGTRDLAVDGAKGALSARLYQAKPLTRKFGRLMVFFHSGGFMAGDLSDSDGFLNELARRDPGLLILAPQYTLATVSPFPAAVDDAHAILNWARVHKTKLRWSGEQLFVGGIEAGAHVATVSNMISNDRGGPKIAGQILIMPMIDPSLSTKSMRECADDACLADTYAASYRSYFKNAADRLHPYGSPLQSSRLKQMAPALIITVEGDPLRDEAELLAARLAAFGVRTSLVRLANTTLVNANARLGIAHGEQVLSAVVALLSKLNNQFHSEPSKGVGHESAFA